jgi:hypothetical protein
MGCRCWYEEQWEREERRRELLQEAAKFELEAREAEAKGWLWEAERLWDEVIKLEIEADKI